MKQNCILRDNKGIFNKELTNQLLSERSRRFQNQALLFCIERLINQNKRSQAIAEKYFCYEKYCEKYFKMISSYISLQEQIFLLGLQTRISLEEIQALN